MSFAAPSPSTITLGTWPGHVARIVRTRSEPTCPVEDELQRCGARVTRLIAGDLRIGFDDRPLRLLGRLYEGLIVPDSVDYPLAVLADATGVRVVADTTVTWAIAT